jgi:hypothetical protein
LPFSNLHWLAVVYSLLRAAQADTDFQQALQRELQFELEGSVPYWRRVTQAQSLWSLALFICGAWRCSSVPGWRRGKR